VAIGSFFVRGHDKTAEAALLAVKYEGSVAKLLHEHGYGATQSVTDDAVDNFGWERCKLPKCAYSGTPASLLKHLKKGHNGSPPG
jgi:hypothetical protein